MKLILKDSVKATKFSAIFQHLKQLVENIVIYFSNTGLYIQGMDNSQICLFECKLSASWFDEYYYSDGVDDPKVCLATGILYKVISAVEDNQIIEISYEGNTDLLHIKFGDRKNWTIHSSNLFNKHFEIALIDLDTELLIIPDQETHVDLKMETIVFSKLITQLLIFSDQLTLTFTDVDIQFKTSGIEGGMSSKIDLDDVNEYAIGEDSVLTQSYSLAIINMMCNFSKLNKNISMGFSDNMPMSLVYNLSSDDDEDDKTCFVGFYLAPRIED